VDAFHDKSIRLLLIGVAVRFIGAVGGVISGSGIVVAQAGALLGDSLPTTSRAETVKQYWVAELSPVMEPDVPVTVWIYVPLPKYIL
jgi:hypothetical protein